MGIISNLVLELVAYPSSCDIMKFWLLTIALVASAIAEPEGEATPKADPKSWYGTYGLGYGTLGYGGYGGYGYGHYLGKRSAEAEADPYGVIVGYYPYGDGYALGGYGLVHGGLLGTHLIGKRSAEAESDPNAWYGTYGLGYGTGYGYGLGYGGYGGYYGGYGK